MVKSNNNKTPQELRRIREQKQRRSEMINTAESYFFKKNFNDIKMDNIAKEAGFSKATLYKYFRNKEELFLAVCANALRTLSDTFEQTFTLPDVGESFQGLHIATSIFIKDHMSYAEIIDDKFLREQLALIMFQLQKNENITATQQEFITQQQRSFALFTKVIEKTIKGINPLITKKMIQKISTALTTISTGVIKESVQRIKYSNQSVNEMEEHLNIIFDIMELGLKSYFK
ncbi:MAG: TetR/AcrR family transcriptional regulator [Candidatus Hodarchaeales archaeon]|jgi:AcrR family transcriptional regulator